MDLSFRYENGVSHVKGERRNPRLFVMQVFLKKEDPYRSNQKGVHAGDKRASKTTSSEN